MNPEEVATLLISFMMFLFAVSFTASCIKRSKSVDDKSVYQIIVWTFGIAYVLLAVIAFL